MSVDLTRQFATSRPVTANQRIAGTRDAVRNAYDWVTEGIRPILHRIGVVVFGLDAQQSHYKNGQYAGQFR